MTTWLGRWRPAKAATMSALAVVLVGATQVAISSPAFAQDTVAEQRLRKMENEIRAIQRQVFPGGDGKFFSPEITPGQPAAQATPGVPASTPVTDLLTRMDTLEAQVAKLTAQIEQTQNRLNQIEGRLPPVAIDPTAGAVAPQAPGGGTPAAPLPIATPAPTPAPTPTPAPAPAPTPAQTTAAPKPATPKPTTTAAATPTPARVAAVRGVEKPATGDAPEDEYNYGFRLWEAKLYPEAQQQLKMYVERYPNHARVSFARNLLGRAYLDDGKPREAATWFLQNYQSNKSGARAADSLLLLGESMRQLKDTSRACIALAEFSETYASEAAGRLKSQYDATRNAVKCPSR